MPLMGDLSKVVRKLVKDPRRGMEVKVKGKAKKVRAMAKLVSEHYPNDPYIKVIFEDGSFMLLVLSEGEVYYADSLLGKAEGITNEMVGQERLVYRGKTYELGNKDDHQYCLQLLVGSPGEIEGECRFSDYFPVSGPKEYLSLGWLAKNGERADINCQIIRSDEVEVVG